MSVPYIEQFEILGKSYGIEDYNDGLPAKDHFMVDLRDHKQFKLWVGGCSIGETDSLREARKLLWQSASSDAKRRHTAALQTLLDTVKVIGGRLDTFRVKHDPIDVPKATVSNVTTLDLKGQYNDTIV